MQQTSRYLPLVLSLAVVPALQAFTPKNGVTSTTEISVLGQTINAYYASDSGFVYGSGNTLFAQPFAGGSPTNLGTVPTPQDSFSAIIQRSNGDVVYADGSFTAPFIHDLGVLSGGNFNELSTFNGVYDFAHNPVTGGLFFSANDGTGSSIYGFNYATGSVTEYIEVLGNSAGLAFDAAGNLFFGSDPDDAIYTVNASLLNSAPGTPLTSADSGISAFITSVNASFLTVGDDGTVVVSANRADFSGTDLLLYNDDGTWRGKAGNTSGFSSYLGEVYWEDDSVYVSETDFFSFSNVLEVGNLSGVPEPAAFPAVGALLALLALRRRR
ncbi:MAG: hypothetical protein ACFB21_00445 [Opitutales bacterium]